MDKWESKIEEAIRQALQDGRTSALPGAGKPLSLDDDAHTPDDMRTAYKIMRDNDVQPEWMMAGKELEEKQRRLLADLKRGFESYRGTLGDIARMTDAARAAERKQSADAAWGRLYRTFTTAIEAYNKQVITYNLKLPPGLPHKAHLNLQRELDKLNRA
ncbi:MAG: DnaJ family domain-containing protein [Anaerolineae bacterium]